MDAADAAARDVSVTEALYILCGQLPRQGPGGDDLTREALGRLPLPRELVRDAAAAVEASGQARVVDLGCGSGRQTLVLAEVLRMRVIAIDIHPRFIERLVAAARARGLAHLIDARVADMTAPGVERGSVELLWSEGAIYVLGFARGLQQWRPLLTPRGLVAVTECSWLDDDPPSEAADFWAQAYPGMENVAGNVSRAQAAGFELLDTFVLPSWAWWDEYYHPLQRRIEELTPVANGALADVVRDAQREIDMYRRHGESFGYVWYLLRNGG